MMRLSRPRKEIEADGRVRLSHRIEIQGDWHDLFMLLPGEPVYEGVEPFIALTLLPAMRMRTDIVVETPVSPKFLEGIEKIQKQFHAWFPGKLKRIRVEAEPMKNLPLMSDAGRAGCLFSGGVDSFYSVLSHREELGGLIFGHGLDIPLSRTDLREKVRAQLLQAAAALGLPLIEVETNALKLFYRKIDWGRHYHGSVLAAIALSLYPRFGRVFVPASRTRETLFPWGSHPDIDPLWSTEWTAIIHDGSDCCRADKVLSIAESEVVQRHLRVCWLNLDGKYNCERCEKCLRTMVVLRIAGVLDKCQSFERALDLSELANLRIATDNEESWINENLRTARRHAQDLELEHALERCLVHNRNRRLRYLRRLYWRVRTKLTGWLGSSPVSKMRNLLINLACLDTCSWLMRAGLME
jgi:hypothetical protein